MTTTTTDQIVPIVEQPLSSTSAISVRHVRKTFHIPTDQLLTLKERALHPVQAFRGTGQELHAVKDMSFDVGLGEFFGIVGRNGSGKSTLLKCIAGIYDVDSGRIKVRGRLSPFIELGVGFNPDLTARDNVIINAIMLGLSRKEARARFDEIIEFAELEDFVDLRLKNYSSGMHVRLAFSVAIQVEADILLIDEVLAVGDASFQQKCFDEFTRLKSEGRTIVFVTHDMHSVERYCDRAMVMEQGKMYEFGEPREMTRRYNELNFGRHVHELPAGDEQRYGDHRRAEIVDGWFENEHGERIHEIEQDEPLAFCFEATFHDEIEEPVFAVSVRNQAGITVFATSTNWKGGDTGRFAAGETAVIRIPFDNRLAPSGYRATPSIARAGPGADAIDVREDLGRIVVHGPRFTGGTTDLEHDILIERE
jgi:ABC-type polysaccharide/polyol phosphate transport system ATPase subunit